MAMNYVGSISILDRGDAPAQAVIDRNARSLAQRIADETKDELEKVMTRVETIYSSFEDTDQVYGTSNLEYLQDITELEELMKDQVKKKKYQQQVTIFIVGFSDVSGQKLRLLQQVNEFFTENSKEIDKEDWFPTTPDLDLEEVGDKIDDSLQTARDLSKRLGELNKEMVEYMANYAEKKASNKGKKKMEKALAQAREEVQTLAEKLMAAQTDLEEKDDKLQSTFKQLEMKNLEVQKFRTAAELAKKAVQDTEALQEEIAARDAKLLEQRQQLTRMEIELAQSNHVKERSQTKMSSMGEESQQKIIMLQKELDEQKKTADDAKRDLTKFHDEQLSALRGVHQQDMEEMKRQHAEQIQSLTSDLQRVTAELASTRNALLELQIEKGVSETQSEVGKHFDLDSEEGTSRNSSKQESRPSTKDKSGRPSGAKKPGAKSPTRSSGGKDAKSSKTSSGGASKEFAEVAIQDEGGDPASALYEENKTKTPGTRHSRRSKSTLAPVEEFEDFEDAYDLSDEQSWASVPKDQLPGRFAQYRRICQNKLREMEEQRQLTVAKTQRKVQLLKAQFVEHKNKWEAERKILIEQVEQAQQLQTDAEKEADQAMTQLEDFITEQEKLEEEEEVRRSAILRGTSSSSLSPANLTPGTKTPLPSSAPAAGATASAHTTPPDSRSTHNSEELQNLLQQTDDAKSQRRGSQEATPSPSNTPGAMGALLDVSRIPVRDRHQQQAPQTRRSPTPSQPTPTSATRQAASKSPTHHTSPTVVEAPAAASEQAVAEVAEVLEEARAVVAEEMVVEGGGGRALATVPPLELSATGSPLEGGLDDLPADLPADLPVIMLTGGQVTAASVLASAGAAQASGSAGPAGRRSGTRSVPGSRGQSKRVLILQPKSVPPSRRGPPASSSSSAANTRAATADLQPLPPPPPFSSSSSALSSAAGFFVPMALDVGALMNPKVVAAAADASCSPTPATTAPPSAALRREITSVQEEVTGAKSATPAAAAPTGRESTASKAEDAAAKASTEKEDTALSAGKEDTDVEKKGEETLVEEEKGEETAVAVVAVDAKGEETAVVVVKEEKGETITVAVATDPEEGEGDAGQEQAAGRERLTTAQVEELRERLAGTKSAPPGVDTADAAADQDEEGAAEDGKEPQRAKTASASHAGITAVPVFKGSQLLQLAALDFIADGGMTVPVIYGNGSSMALFDVIPGLVTPFPAPVDPDLPRGTTTTTTFLTPEGHLVVTDPMSPREGATRGLVAVEVRASPTAAAGATPSLSAGRIRTGGGSGILRGGRPSPAHSPTRQVSFVSSARMDAPSPSEGGMSPRMSRLRRSRTADELSVVMETALPPAQESALDSMRKLLMEENLAPQQQQTLDSVRSAMSRVKTSAAAANANAKAKAADVTAVGSKQEVRGSADGSSRAALSSEEMLRTMTVFTLASQLSHEALQLGVRPESIFRNFGRLDSQVLSEIAPRRSGLGAGKVPRPEGVSTDTTQAELLLSQASDMAENEARGPSAEAARQVALSELRDLPPIDGTAQDPSASTPSTHPPPTAATIGSLPAHDQLETPLAELAEQDAAKYAKGDKDVGQDGGELKDEASNLEKGRTDVTGDRQGTEVTEKSVSTMAVPESDGGGGGGTSEGTADSTNASRAVQPPSKTPDTVIKIDGDTEDELREASARSRASLRTHYKNQLEETRQAAEDRRSKTPVITLPSKLSVDDELVLDEDEEDEFDEEMALPDDLKEELEEQKRKLSMYEIGTSPPPGPGKDPSSHSVHLASRKAGTLVDHPLLEEYLKTYDGVASFKNTLSTLFLDKDMMSASQILADLETLVFDREKKVMPQVEQLTINALFILEEIASVISGAVMVDREPPVSSLLPYSRDEGRSRLPPTREASEDVYPAYTHPKMVTPASASGTEQVFVNNVSDGSGGAAGVKGDGVDATVSADARAAEVTGRVSAGSGGDAVEGGSQAGSLQGSRKSSVSGSTKQYLADLQAQCSVLQARLEEENKKHEEQLRHNTVVMMEMQDTINELQRELSALGKSSARKARSATSSALGLAKTPSPDQSLMFTRLDLERNAKIMKKAVMDQRLDADRYKEAVTTMDDYVSLPAQRLAHLVKKYVHHSRMKEIEENVKNSESLDEQVFDTLDKMEALQNQRARHWAEKMDMMGFERLRLAAMLMDSLDSIEQESGLFLIKPMYSYRGRELKAPPTQKLVRPVRTQPVQRHPSAAHESTTSFVPAPTPASNARRMERTHTPSHQPVVDLTAFPPPPPSRPEDGVVGAGVVRTSIGTPQAPQLVQSYQTWNMSASQARSPIDGSQHPLNTPRMLELDINRMLIGQNNISTKLPHPPTDDRLVNASNNGLRSYVTVQRPTAALAGERPTSANAGGRDTGAPPSSPSPRPQVPVSPADRDLPDTMTSPPPLPPISVGDRAASASSSNNDEPEPPQSPPGSSMYQSTMHDPEEGPMVKAVTRTSSQLTTSLLTDEEED